MFTKKLVGLTFLLVAMVLSISASMFTTASASTAKSYDDGMWKNSVGELIVANDGKVRLTDGGMFYGENLANKDYYDEYNALYLKADFIATKTAVENLKNQVYFFINSVEMTDMSTITKYGTPESTMMGPRTYEQNEDQWNIGQILARLCDYSNYKTSTYKLLDSVAIHSVSWLIDSTGVYTYFDETLIKSDGKPYKAQKSADEIWTINDFLDGEGNPVLYFGCYTKTAATGWISVDMVNITNSDGLTTVGEFRGETDKIYEEEEKIYLKNGNAFAKQSLDLTKSIIGQLDIKEVPGYSVDLAATNETFACISIKDSKKRESDGNGFRISLYPLSESGKDRTKIEIGYLVEGNYTSFKTITSSYSTVGVHNFAVITGADRYTIIVDGESAQFGMMSVTGLISLGQKINKQEIYAYYSLDAKFGSEYTGNWLAELTLPTEKEFVDYATIGLSDDKFEVTGEVGKTDTEINEKTYSAVTSNKSIAIDGAQGIVAVTVLEPTPIWSRINELIDVKVKMTDLTQIGLNENSTITLMLSAVEGGSFTPDVADACFFINLKIKDVNTLLAECNMETETAAKEIKITDGEFVISFGWENNKSVIAANGVTLLEGSMGTGGFASANGMTGYLTAKYVSATDTPLSFTLTSPTQRLSKIVETPPIDSTDNSTSNSTELNEPKKGCKLAIMDGKIVSFTIILTVIALVFIVKKSKKSTEL